MVKVSNLLNRMEEMGIRKSRKQQMVLYMYNQDGDVFHKKHNTNAKREEQTCRKRNGRT